MELIDWMNNVLPMMTGVVASIGSMLFAFRILKQVKRYRKIKKI